jgi:hypothetical protein
MTKGRTIILAVAIPFLVVGCWKKDGSEGATTGAKADSNPSLAAGCDHDLRSRVILEHTWPYPADFKDLRWIDRYTTVQLRLRPVHAAFVTATLTYRRGDFVPVEDSQVHVIKPRRLVAKRDLVVLRKVWDQGTQVDRHVLAAAKGELGSFLFYNSRGMCLLETEQGPGWTACTLDDSFEGLSAEHPFACEQVWWVKVRKSRIEQGWIEFDASLMERVPPASDEAK